MSYVNRVREWLRVERESENGGRTTFDTLLAARASIACRVGAGLDLDVRLTPDQKIGEVRNALMALAEGEDVPWRYATAIAAALR